MQNSIELYINNTLVEFNEPPQINITYLHEDLHNPTVIKNSFSKTVTVKGTKNNNALFGCFYDNTRIISYEDPSLYGASFNPSKKVDFVLYKNGEIIEKGYAKLDEVIKNGNDIEYHISLFGGLGQFLYNLTYDEYDEELKLSNLDYGVDLDFPVDKNIIYDAWNRLNNIDNNGTDRFDVINFTPCYNGIPTENFDANKVVINLNDNRFGINEEIYDAENGTTYSTVDGYVLGELINEVDDVMVGDYRSYLQRPVLRVKSMIDAICNFTDYEVDLDADFFNVNNPYYNDSWMTLPLVTETDIENAEVVTQVDDKFYLNDIATGNKVKLSIPFIPVANPQGINESSNELIRTGRNYRNISTQTTTITNTAVYYQLVAYNANNEVVNVSKIYSFFTDIDNTKKYFEYYNYSPYPTGLNNVTEITGFFKKYIDVDNQYFFCVSNDKINVEPRQYFTLDIEVEYEDGMYFMLKQNNTKTVNIINGTVSLTDNPRLYTFNNNYSFDVSSLIDFDAINKTFSKGYQFKKDIMLNSENTPCKYFLDYLKLFNLHIWYDSYLNKVFIRTRQNFFIDKVKDLDDLIDRSKDMKITPLTFNNKWFSFYNSTETDEKLYKDYLNRYGYKYGEKLINTNYNFDNSKLELFEENIYKGGIMSVNKNKYYCKTKNTNSGIFVDDINLTYFNGEDTFTTSLYGTKNVSFWDVNNKYGDIIPRVSFTDNKNEGVNGSNTLLFFNGFKNVSNQNFKLTDDLPIFNEINEGTPCWIVTTSEVDDNNNEIALNIIDLPMFSRYKTVGDKYPTVTYSMDFGTPQEVYIPYLTIDDNSNIYSQYWKSFMEDRYNINNRIIECSVLFNERVEGDWLKQFYYFDNSLWIMQEIIDYNSSSNDTTKCNLVKITDKNNYLL